ncbi:MAG: DUF1697 domain-containing protein [Novosphingobium sp.]
MPRYVAFFGSLNVGSSNRVTMADLRYAFEREGLDNVETVVASGNVLFDFDERPSEGLEDMLAHVMQERLDITTFAAVRSRDEVAEAISANPFAADGDEAKVHTMFLSAQPDAAAFERLVADHALRGPERLASGDRALYIDYVDGAGSSKLTNMFIERRLACKGTARNIRSLTRILEKMSEG